MSVKTVEHHIYLFQFKTNKLNNKKVITKCRLYTCHESISDVNIKSKFPIPDVWLKCFEPVVLVTKPVHIRLKSVKGQLTPH